MRKILLLLFIGFLFFSCETGLNDDGIRHPDDTSHLGPGSNPGSDYQPPWFYDAAVTSASMFYYDSTVPGVGYTPDRPPNNHFTNPNERLGVCVDYSIHFALLTDSYVISSNTNSAIRGIYEIVGPIEVPMDDGSNVRLYRNGIIYNSRDRTEAWELRKVGEFDPSLLLGYSEENHAWNLTKDGWIVDVMVKDFGWPNWYQQR